MVAVQQSMDPTNHRSSFLSIFTDPITNFLRSIPIEVLDQNDELSPSQKDDGMSIIDEEDQEYLDEFEEDSEDERLKSENLGIIEVFQYKPQNIPIIVCEEVEEEVKEEENNNNEDSKKDISDILDSIIDQITAKETEIEIEISTSCEFVRSSQFCRTKRTFPHTTFVFTLPRVEATFKLPPPKKISKIKPKIKTQKMAAEVLQQPNDAPHCFIASPSNIDRPFKLLVQKETFLIDADSMSRISPIFSVMCFGKDFEKMDLSREIVDEKSGDIDCFLRAVHDTSMINSSNFSLVLRLSNKYQVNPVIEACQQFIMRQHLDVLKPDEILTMLIAAHEHHCRKEVIQKLIRRLSSEGNSVFTKLKISRYLPAQVYGSVISTSMNLNSIKEHEAMNGHVLKLERSKIRWRQSVCEECKSIAECANCEECKKTMCRQHVEKQKCSSDYGNRLSADLKKNVVDFEWND